MIFRFITILPTIRRPSDVHCRALRNRIGSQRLIAVLELRSNTMRAGIHKHALAKALSGADLACVYAPP